MKVYALVGKSGTGKSYQAQNLCKELNIEAIIDDGLFIYENKVMAGISAKRQATKVGAVKTALFTKEEHQQDVAASVQKTKPRKILVIGTSDEMVRRICARLEFPEISETIYITDITTESERAIAHKQRHELGKHVIPAPAFQLKRQFSGYFMSPLLIFKEWSANKGGVAEKSVVRPTYSYMGDYKLSDKVFSDIIECAAAEIEGVDSVARVLTITAAEGVELNAAVIMEYGCNMVLQAKKLQEEAARQIENMTAFSVNRFDIEIKGIK
ncbi:Asp23/Gls24 family envelope stress response protein [bacterium 210820-DFI.6.37]|nr:Asp23/Gls24 family envelope stress response protein [bacterium 210820-DFI.6.37]